MIHLGRLSMLGTGIVFGGLTLGAALASYANPLPRPAEPAPWHNALGAQVASSDVQPYAYSTMPEDLTFVRTPDSYAPPAAFTEMRWPVEMRGEPAYHEAAPVAATPRRADLAAADSDEYAQLADQEVAAPHYQDIEQAAARDSADVPAPDAQPAAAVAVTAPAEGGARLIHIADAR